MQQSSRVCALPDDNQMNIVYICTYSECETNRLLCSACISDGNHKHD